ncbi:MAG: hypothetical protein IPM77_07600 [Crocinitomicaceae bacterium]|nr:hypothetical protein [Crocinitomicaceae bacterium]
MIAIFLFFNCNKEESEMWTEVHVSAKNAHTGEPLSDIYIGLIEWDNRLLFDSKGKSISEGFTDTNGEYHFEWKARRGNGFTYDYVAQANPEKYYQENFQQIDFLKKGEIHHYNITLLPYAGLYYHIQNENCFDGTDSMWFKREHDLIDYQSEDWNPLPRVGCYSLFSDIPYDVPMGNYTFTMKIKRNGIITYLEKEITLIEGQVDTIELFY